MVRLSWKTHHGDQTTHGSASTVGELPLEDLLTDNLGGPRASKYRLYIVGNDYIYPKHLFILRRVSTCRCSIEIGIK
jgi:hypothetical protein